MTNAARAELIGWWTFDEGSGDIASDLSDYGNDGILRGDPQWVDGIFGGAIDLLFEGTGFLRHMVRNVVGTLLETGSGRRRPAV